MQNQDLKNGSVANANRSLSTQVDQTEIEVDNASMNIADCTKNTYLFRGTTADDLSALSGITDQAALLPGKLVYEIDQVSDAIFIIEMGTVDIVVKGKQAPGCDDGKRSDARRTRFFSASQANDLPPLPPASARRLYEYLLITRAVAYRPADTRPPLLPQRVHVSRQAC